MGKTGKTLKIRDSRSKVRINKKLQYLFAMENKHLENSPNWNTFDGECCDSNDPR